MIQITQTIALHPDEIEEHFIRASGPGGQNVNKVASAVQLRFDMARSPSLPAAVKQRLVQLAGQRLTRDGVIVITAQSHRSQERNRAEALERLVDLIRKATIRQRPRIPTRPTLGSKKRRLAGKTHQGKIKALRGKPPPE
ncbi:MAG: aminoacyl-tRNA hydrolase [Salinarimonas sp.]|nr:aminoacyl-tRNA hydrolase [Salinarimonas sp.]